MTAETTDYVANLHQLNQTRYIVTLIGWDQTSEEPTRDTMPGTFRNVLEAKAAVAAQAAANDFLWVEAWEIRRGQWRREDFDDEVYDRVIDANWYEDDDFHLYGDRPGDGSIRWESAI